MARMRSMTRTHSPFCPLPAGTLTDDDMTFDPEGAAASYEIASRYAKPIEPLPQRSP